MSNAPVPRRSTLIRALGSDQRRIRRLEVNNNPQLPDLDSEVDQGSAVFHYDWITGAVPGGPVFAFDSSDAPWAACPVTTPQPNLTGITVPTHGVLRIPAQTLWWCWSKTRAGPLGGTAAGGIGNPRAPDAWVLCSPLGATQMANWIPVDPATLPSSYLGLTAPTAPSQDLVCHTFGATGPVTKDIKVCTLYTAITAGAGGEPLSFAPVVGAEFIPMFTELNFMTLVQTSPAAPFDNILNW